MSTHEHEVKVWDPLVRVFHWSLVLAFTLAYVSGEHLEWLHLGAGYTVMALVLVRVLWGFIGTRYARFSDFVRPWSEVRAYLKALSMLRPPHYLGHNPAGGAMVVALLGGLLLTTLSGMAAYGVESGQGPLASLHGLGHFWEEVFEEGHELLVHLTLALVVVHVAGVLVGSFAHAENLPRAMVTGWKRRD